MPPSTRRKQPVRLAAPVATKNAKVPTKAKIDESKTAVSTADIASAPPEDVIELSSDPESEYDDEEVDASEDGLAQETPTNGVNGKPADEQMGEAATVSRIPNGKDADTEMLEGSVAEQEEDDASPTFGDLVRNTETVDVPAALAAQQPATTGAVTTAASHQPRTIAPPSLASLGTVLNQALRTDDADLLESCLHTTDLPTVRNTIQRMDSALAGTLLAKLAARLHRRPGRAHSLMSWVQTTLIAHGGALATQPEVVRRLAELNRVLDERARGLSSLLVLKGKLELLEGQMALRRSNRSRGAARRRRGAPRAAGGADGDADMDEDEGEDEDADEGEQGVVYVEGQEDEVPTNGVMARRNGLINMNGEDEEDGDDEFPTMNGTGMDSDEDEDEDEDLDGGDLIDDEAAESSMDEDEVDHDDLDEEESGEEDDEDEESEAEAAAPPAKIRKQGGGFGKRR